MSERYSKLFSMPENIYAEGAPVIVSAGNLLKDNQTGNVLVQLKIKNISEKTVKAAKVRIHALDTTGKTIDGDAEQEYLDLSVKQGEEFGQKTAITLPNTSTRGFSVEVMQVVFTDNSTWENTGMAWEPLPTRKSLNHFLNDSELVKQYQIHFGGKCDYAPQEQKDLWLCACGEWNKGNKCYSCGKAKQSQFALDIDVLKSDKDVRLEKENAERETKEAAEKATAEAKAKTAKKTKKLIAILAPIVVIIIAVLAILVSNGHKSAQNAILEEAETLLAEGNIREAGNKMKELGFVNDERAQAIWERTTGRQKKAYYSDGLTDKFELSVNKDGTVTASGSNKSGRMNVGDWGDIVAVAVGYKHSVGLHSDGTVIATGDNSKGQCNVESWKNVIYIGAARNFTIGFTADGQLLSTGEFTYKLQGGTESYRFGSDWNDVICIVNAGGCFAGLKSDGSVVATGRNLEGQCNVGGWKDIISISAGNWYVSGKQEDGTTVLAGKKR